MRKEPNIYAIDKKVQKHLAVSTIIVIFAANKRIAASYKHMEALNKVPWAAKSPIFKKVSEISDISALSREERINYDHTKKVTYGSFCRIECAPIPYKHRHSERFKVLSCKIELFNSSIGHFAG